jgi:NTP pyrophosphatase (non-canonical NTP hydrolase)
MHLNEICDEAYNNAKEKGWHENFNAMEKLALIHSEVSEAVEDYRYSKMETYFEADGKPCGFPSELADIVIRVGDLAKYLGIDLEEIIKMKMTYNKSRSYRHGGKRC